MPSSATVSIGRMVMREDWSVSESDDRVLALSGQESIPRLTAAAVVSRREDFLSITGQMLPVRFSTKSYLDGFYAVQDTQGEITDWKDNLRVFRWQCSLQRLGTESEVDIESRLSGALSRSNNFTITGERVHAPAIGHNAYWSDATVTGAVVRAAEDGSIRVYRGLGIGVSPRWAVTPAAYSGGRARLLVDAQERAGTAFKLSPLSWEISNGLVRVRPGTLFEIAAYTGGSWKPKSWDVLSGGVSLGTFDYATVLDNRYESVTLRLMKSLTTGRIFVDLTLRRGFRFVEIYVQAEFGATLKIQRSSSEAGTNSLAGTVVAVSNDPDNKYIIGSSKSFDPDVAVGGISKTATPTLDAFIGVIAGGSGAVTGDQATDLRAQYIGAPAEIVGAVRR